MQVEIYKALQRRYEAKIVEAEVEIELYMKNTVGVADHPNLVDTLDGLFQKWNAANERLEGLNKFWWSRNEEAEKS